LKKNEADRSESGRDNAGIDLGCEERAEQMEVYRDRSEREEVRESASVKEQRYTI